VADNLATPLHAPSPATRPPSSQAQEQTPPDPYATRPTIDDVVCPVALASQVSVPGYEIMGELGRGGMGVVYRARQIELKRVVALKMILAGGHAGEMALARFRREAEAIARLQHPNIVQIHEVGEHEGRPYFSLEFCGGGSLAKRIAGSPLLPSEAATVVQILARAIHVAHQKGIVHRDLKPGNVLLTEDGTPKVTDFGLAKQLDEVGQTASGAVMGTPSYMAPEQAAGRKDVGTAADVYALGAILYECLTGRPPFRAATPLDTVMQVINDDPVPPRQLNAGVPKDLEAVCLKCLHKIPPRRYGTAEALAADLARFLEGEPISIQQSGLLDRLAGALDRVQLQAQFAAYGSLLLWLALAMFLPEVLVNVAIVLDGPFYLVALGQFGRLAAFLVLVGYFRGWQWAPRGAVERQLWFVWGGYMLACLAFATSSRLVIGWGNMVELKFYQGLAALAALAFFSLAGNFWGYCAVIGLGFLALAYLMAANLLWAPIEFGAAWAIVLVFLGLRLRRLGKQSL
jgi:hypothetical protein